METTSDLRRVLAASVCAEVYKGSSEVKQWLAAELDSCPFEDMTDTQMVELAMRVLVASEVERICVEVSATRYEMEPVYRLCPDCNDEHHLLDPLTGRWYRCSRCNPRRLVEAVAKARKATIEAEADEPVPA